MDRTPDNPFPIPGGNTKDYPPAALSAISFSTAAKGYPYVAFRID